MCVIDTLTCLRQLCVRLDFAVEQVAYMGDDLPDIPILQAVGYSIAPADAVMVVRQMVCYVTSKQGGHGAVREVCDLILDSLGN